MRNPKEIAILIVDDEVALRDALVFDFKRKGFTVFEAGSGSQAYEIVQREKIDVVLTDVRMAGGDGIELLDRIKARNATLPVVMFITGFADISLEDAYEKGADAVLPKPFDRKVLLNAVLRSASPKQEAWSPPDPEAKRSDFEIRLHLDALETSITAKELNIARGGMFVQIAKDFPVIGAKVSFSIRFRTGRLKMIEGTGIVRWIRGEATDTHPTGCGIEFEYLEDETRSEMAAIVEQLKTVSFIPKS